MIIPERPQRTGAAPAAGAMHPQRARIAATSDIACAFDKILHEKQRH
jgi:hypothetical protein